MGGDQRRLAKEISFEVSESKYKKIKTFTLWLWCANVHPGYPGKAQPFMFSLRLAPVSQQSLMIITIVTIATQPPSQHGIACRRTLDCAIQGSTALFSSFGRRSGSSGTPWAKRPLHSKNALHHSKTSLLLLKLCRIFFTKIILFMFYFPECVIALAFGVFFLNSKIHQKHIECSAMVWWKECRGVPQCRM